MGSYRSLLTLVALLLTTLVGAVVFLSRGATPRADFTFVNGTEIRSVDPAMVTGQPEGRIITAIFEGLVNWDPRTLAPIPGVAERWDISPDGLRYTFRLRANARWTDGSPVTAGDFVWSFRRFLDPTTAAEYSYQLWYMKNARRYSTAQVRVGDRVEVELDTPKPGALPFARRQVLRGVLKSVDEKLKVYQVEIAGQARYFQLPDQPSTAMQTGSLGTKLQPCRQILLDFAEVGARAVDERTLVIELENPTPYFLGLSGFYPYFAVNPRCVETHGYPAWTRPENIVSNGAFSLVERRVRDRIRLVKSPTYWNHQNVALRTIDALAIESASTALNLYLTGQVDWITSVPPTVVGELLAQQREDFRPVPELTVNFYRINCRRPGLSDPRVRRALAMAINKQELVDTVTRAGELPAGSLVPPGIAGYQSARCSPYDPEAARKLLAEAGFPGGRGLPVLDILINNEETHRTIAELIQHQWRTQLGVQVSIRGQEWNSMLSDVQLGKYQIARAGWIGDYLDPNTFLDMFVTDGANNQTGWSNQTFDKLIDEAARERDPAKRMKQLHDAEQLLLDEEPVIPLYFRVSRNMIRPYVKGFYNNLQDVHPLGALSIDQAEKQRVLAAEGLQ